VIVIGLGVLVGSLSALSNGAAPAGPQGGDGDRGLQLRAAAAHLSSAFMQADLMPGWIQTVARYNPVEWAAQAGRGALTASPDWGLVVSRAGLLAALCLVCTWLATRALRSYQRSI
jgi:hypothetical protein